MTFPLSLSCERTENRETRREVRSVGSDGPDRDRPMREEGIREGVVALQSKRYGERKIKEMGWVHTGERNKRR
mgnify:CR=1 FL=1